MSTSVASVVSHFPDAENGFSTTTSGSVASGAATVGLASVGGYTNGQPAVFVIDPTDTSKKQTFTGIIDTSGVQVTSVVWTAGTNQTHALGATVVDYATATHIAMISKGIQVGHTQKGNHKTLTDDNANEWIGLTTTGSAVNYVDIANAATGTDPVISAKGDDATINLNLRGKGLAKTVTIGAGATIIFPYDYVVSGCVITADAAGSTLNFSMTSGVVVINGNPVTVASFSASAATASRDTYVDVLDNGNGTGLVVKTGGNIVTNNAASPALASNSVRLGIVVSGAGNIAAAASINQGQEDRVLPIASSIAYSVTDSLGNLICPRDPSRKILGMRQRVADFSSGTTADTLITGFNCPVIIPTGRKVKITIYSTSSASAGVSVIKLYEGIFGSGGVQKQQYNQSSTNSSVGLMFEYTPTSGSVTFTASVGSTSGNPTFVGAANNPSYILVELT